MEWCSLVGKYIAGKDTSKAIRGSSGCLSGRSVIGREGLTVRTASDSLSPGALSSLICSLCFAVE